MARSKSIKRPWGRPGAGAWALTVAALCTSGCVERFLRVETRPAGATVFINGERAGESPLEWPFTHYGTVRIDVWRDGHRAKTTFVELETPWYQWVPLDLFSELLSPLTHVDEHTCVLELEPAPTTIVPDPAAAGNEELLERADELRKSPG
jgi:hypothetical protein